MGQFALGLRSLLIRAAIFVVMAALLVWALGGTLFPKPQLARFEPVSFAGENWSWQLAVGGRNPGEMRWRLMVEDQSGNEKPFDERSWVDVSGPVVANDNLFIAARATKIPTEPWRIEQINRDRQVVVHPMPDRLAVEQQLARLRANLPLQDDETIRRQRQTVLDPP